MTRRITVMVDFEEIEQGTVAKIEWRLASAMRSDGKNTVAWHPLTGWVAFGPTRAREVTE